MSAWWLEVGYGRGLVSPVGEKALDVAISPACVDRSLRILDALCKAIKARRIPLEAGPTLSVHGIPISFLLEERVRQHEKPRPKPRPGSLLPSYVPFEERYDFIPTGELRLKAWVKDGFRREWADGKRLTLEKRVNDILIGFVESPPAQSVQKDGTTSATGP